MGLSLVLFFMSSPHSDPADGPYHGCLQAPRGHNGNLASDHIWGGEGAERDLPSLFLRPNEEQVLRGRSPVENE